MYYAHYTRGKTWKYFYMFCRIYCGRTAGRVRNNRFSTMGEIQNALETSRVCIIYINASFFFFINVLPKPPEL